MKLFIIRWTGDCRIEAETLEAAIEEMKKNARLVVTCSRFEGREEEKQHE